MQMAQPARLCQTLQSDYRIVPFVMMSSLHMVIMAKSLVWASIFVLLLCHYPQSHIESSEELGYIQILQVSFVILYQ